MPLVAGNLIALTKGRPTDLIILGMENFNAVFAIAQGGIATQVGAHPIAQDLALIGTRIVQQNPITAITRDQITFPCQTDLGLRGLEDLNTVAAIAPCRHPIPVHPNAIEVDESFTGGGTEDTDSRALVISDHVVAQDIFRGVIDLDPMSLIPNRGTAVLTQADEIILHHVLLRLRAFHVHPRFQVSRDNVSLEPLGTTDEIEGGVINNDAILTITQRTQAILGQANDVLTQEIIPGAWVYETNPKVTVPRDDIFLNGIIFGPLPQLNPSLAIWQALQPR